MNKPVNITFKQVTKNDPIPYDLLLLADPSREMVDQYIDKSKVYGAMQRGEIIGVIALYPVSIATLEIKNIAVHPKFQNQGIGSLLLKYALRVADDSGYKSIQIGTANSSVGQLYLYQKFGFEIVGIKKNFFTDHYILPIYENGIQAKHLVMLERKI